MGEVIRLAPRLRAVSVNTDDLRIPASECPTCTGRGYLLFKDKDGFLASTHCPCGGDDENRIYPDGPDYPGAA